MSMRTRRRVERKALSTVDETERLVRSAPATGGAGVMMGSKVGRVAQREGSTPCAQLCPMREHSTRVLCAPPPPVHSSMRVDLRARTEASAQGTGGGGRGWAGRAELTTEGLWVPAWVAVGLRWKEFDFDKQRSRKSGRLRSG